MTAKLNRDADSVARRELNVYHLERACSGYLFLRLVASVIDRWQRTFPARNVQAFRSVFLVKDGLLDKLPPLRTAQVVVWDADAMVKVRFEKARGIWYVLRTARTIGYSRGQPGCESCSGYASSLGETWDGGTGFVSTHRDTKWTGMA